jgi:hypothetical protein
VGTQFPDAPASLKCEQTSKHSLAFGTAERGNEWPTMENVIKDLYQKFQQKEEQLHRRERHKIEVLEPASAKDIQKAIEFGFPKELLDFYRLCNPKVCIEFKQRIWSIDHAIVENEGAVPGCALFPHGYVVFASNGCGDAYCLDMNVATPEGIHPVAIFPHDAIDEEAELATIQSYRFQVADSLEDFLVKFINETLRDEPFYG